MFTIEVVDEVDGVFVDIGQQFHRQLGESTLGVAVRGRRVVGRAEVTVRVNQGVAQRKVLSHPNQRIVDGLIAVGVVASDYVANDGGALHVTSIRLVARVKHRPENTSMNRF